VGGRLAGMSAVPPGDRDPREILAEARTIAVVGLSSDPSRPSHDVAAYLQRAGYRIVPVNPNESEVLGERAYPSLLDVDGEQRIDVVDVFRRAEHTPAVARDAVRIGADMLWLQQGIVSEEARSIAETGGLVVVMDACIRTVHRMWVD
jgi:predicted CoA-binding protein